MAVDLFIAAINQANFSIKCPHFPYWIKSQAQSELKHPLQFSAVFAYNPIKKTELPGSYHPGNLAL